MMRTAEGAGARESGSRVFPGNGMDERRLECLVGRKRRPAMSAKSETAEPAGSAAGSPSGNSPVLNAESPAMESCRTPSTRTMPPSAPPQRRSKPWLRAHSAYANRPATPRTRPSRESSPTSSLPWTCRGSICLVAMSSPAAMGRSNPDPVFFSEPGARLTTTRSLGMEKPLARIAARTRSRDSWMAASGIPTMKKPGIPLPTTTSTSTGTASTPRNVALRTMHWPGMALTPPRTR